MFEKLVAARALRAPIASFAMAVLLTGCGSVAPQYKVGASEPQTKSLAQRTFAEQVDARTGSSDTFDTPPKVLSSNFPEYPQTWRALNIQGRVVVLFTVDTRGRVADPQVQGSPPAELAAISLHAILTWRFTPAMKAGAPVPVRVRQTFEFRLE